MTASVGNLPCAAHEKDAGESKRLIASTRETLSALVSKVDALSSLAAKVDSLSSVAGKVDTIMAMMVQNTGIFAKEDMVSQKNSPRSLNDTGRSIFTQVGGQGFLESNKEMLFAGIDRFSPQTPLDVERYAAIVLKINENSPIFNGIKDWVYNSPSFERKTPDGNTVTDSWTLDDVIFILSLPLRDLYLQSHPLQKHM